MEMDERVERFRRCFDRPMKRNSERDTMVKMIYDLIDDRQDLKARVGVLTVACAAAVILVEELKAELDLRRET